MLMHNQTIQILECPYSGFFRVIVDDPGLNRTALVQIDADNTTPRGGRPKKSATKKPRKKPRPPLTTQIKWFPRQKLCDLHESGLLKIIKLEPDSKLLQQHINDHSAHQLHQKRVKIMSAFLNYEQLSESIFIHGNISGLVKETMQQHDISRSFVYANFSLLCRFGFSSLSLFPRYDRCGAPGVPRPCEPNGRKKAGAKTTAQKIAKDSGHNIDPEQPGMSSQWRSLVLAADNQIPKPKPPMNDRITIIQEKAFVSDYVIDADGIISPVLIKGSYPNRNQIRHVLSVAIPKLEKVLQSTTSKHFTRSLRGSKNRSWKGVMGPGHTWQIDSTVGDIYLRSSVNRTWIIGRPIVYILVDVWSTAIVGFYVCLAGPSWDMAKISLFCSSVDPELLGGLWGFKPTISLNPHPTLCSILLCDRGEYLSKGASSTGCKLRLNLDYTPPYRPDLKGLVEVLHRIAKDQQFTFVPGAIDHRRKEFDLKKYKPETAVFTVPEYVNFLHIVFSQYNLTADRKHRLDSHMKAANVDATPSGLWRWGHQVGLGFQRHTSESELITTLLPNVTGKVRHNGIYVGDNQYDSQIVVDQQWITHARNFGAYSIPANFFPGSVSRVWTPHGTETGLHELTISDQALASPELTWDEVADAKMYDLAKNAQDEHEKDLLKIVGLKQREQIIENAKEKTKLALSDSKEDIPTIREAKQEEVKANLMRPSNVQAPIKDSISIPDSSEYTKIMRKILEQGA